MAECMIFPDTVEEFMEQYKVVDTEQVYTNGTEFVPIYRMKQWFQHEPEIIRCKDCKWWGYDDDDGVVRMCHAAKHNYVSPHWNVFICRTYKGDYYCADAERRTDEN